MRRRALLAVVFALAACTRSARSHKPRFTRTAAPGGVHLIYEIDSACAWERDRDREALLARTVRVLRARVAGLVDGGVVRLMQPGSGIEVFLPDGPPAMYEAWRRLARLPARFEIQLVDDGSAFFTDLTRLTMATSPAGVEATADQWSDPRGGSLHTDPYLVAGDRQRLIDVLAADAVRNPLPPDREILLEHNGGKWRSYFVIKDGGLDDGGLDNGDIADAVAQFSRYDGRPELEIVLTAAGRRRFTELTTRSVGRKFVVVIDGTVQTAPVLITPIASDRMRVATSSDPSADRAAVREDLANLGAALRSGPLPAPVMFMVEEQVARLP